MTAFLIISLLGLYTYSASAQSDSRAAVGGKVTDPQGAVIPGASVAVTNDETGVVIKAKTGPTGEWIVRYLNPGVYHFEVTAAGFKKLVRSSFQLVVADSKIIDAQMELGANTETVSVEATTPLIDMTSSANGTVVEQSELNEIPNLSNAPTQLIGLVSGAQTGSAVGGTGVYLWSNGGLSGGAIDGSGSGTLAINYTIDGANDNQNNGSISFEPPSDAIGQFRVITNAYDASVGRQAAGTVNLDMKAGEAKFHGDAYENNYTNFLNARPYNSTTNPATHLNQYGGSVGGPVWLPKLYDGRNRKTFFFYTFSGIRNHQPGSTGTMSLPTEDELKGDFSKSYQKAGGVVYNAQIFNPYTYNASTGTRTQFTNNIITTPMSGFASALAKWFPQIPVTASDGASSDSNNYTKNEMQQDKYAGQTLRVDQNWNNNNHTFATFRWNNWTELSYDPFGAGNILNGLYQQRTNKGMTLDHTITLSQSLLADLKFNLSRYFATGYSASLNVDPSQYGLPSSFISVMNPRTLPEFKWGGVGYETDGMGTSQANNASVDQNYTLDVNMTQMHGNHTLRYGYEFMVQQDGADTGGAAGGIFNFGNGGVWQSNHFTSQNPDASMGYGTGSAVAAFYMGLPDAGSYTTPITSLYSQHFTAFYFQDDWRYSNKLTFNVGLRWDYERPEEERHNAFFSRFDPNYVNAATSAAAQANYANIFTANNAGSTLVQNYGPTVGLLQAKGAILYAGAPGENGATTSRAVVNPRYIYFQPRLGFAYQLLPTTTIRGGMGRFVEPSYITGSQTGYQTTTNMTNTTDNYHSIVEDMSSAFTRTTMQTPTGNSKGINTNLGSVGSFTDPNIGRVYVDEASLSVQHQWRDILGEVGGVYSLTSGENESYNINLPSATAYLAAYSPVFDGTGKPSDPFPGDTQVPNPFKGAPNLNTASSIYTSSTLSAYQLLRPNQVAGSITETKSTGRDRYYAMQAKLEKRYHNGYSVLASFTWSKHMAENSFLGNHQELSQKLQKELSSADQTLHFTLAPVVELPFGAGKKYMGNSSRLMNALVGGYELSGVYTFFTGTPIWLPTNSSFFEGGDPGKGFTKSPSQMFDTNKFRPFPTKSTTVATLNNTTNYPSWTGVTGMAGANYVPTSSTASVQNGVYQDFSTWNTTNPNYFGSVRNPRVDDITFGIRKQFVVVGGVKLQLRMDMNNALNHPRFGSVDTSASDWGGNFGRVSGTSNPARVTTVNGQRTIQLGGKITF
jgi:hypothetical protein